MASNTVPHADLKVHICIAVSDAGQVQVFDGDYATSLAVSDGKFRRWKNLLQKGGYTWTFKHVVTNVPLPVQFEDQTPPQPPPSSPLTITRVQGEPK